MADCELEAEAQGCRVELRSGGPLTVRGDRAVLNKAFEHVLRNAICRAPAGTAVEIEVKLTSQLGRATVSIRDHAPGVPPEALSGIFTPFYGVTKNRGQASHEAVLDLAMSRPRHRAESRDDRRCQRQARPRRGHRAGLPVRIRRESCRADGSP